VSVVAGWSSTIRSAYMTTSAATWLGTSDNPGQADRYGVLVLRDWWGEPPGPPFAPGA
jgi:hypothetical protein